MQQPRGAAESCSCLSVRLGASGDRGYRARRQQKPHRERERERETERESETERERESET